MSTDTAVSIFRQPLLKLSSLNLVMSRTMSPIPVGAYVLRDYFLDTIGAYVFRGRCPWSMTGHISSNNYVILSNEASTFSVAILTCSVVRLTRCVSGNRKETTKYDHTFCFVYLDYHVSTQCTITTVILCLRNRRYVYGKLLFQHKTKGIIYLYSGQCMVDLTNN